MHSGPLWTWEMTYFSFGVLLQFIYQVTHEAPSFVWCPEQKKSLQESKMAAHGMASCKIVCE